jgi:hypothetical protein
VLWFGLVRAGSLADNYEAPTAAVKRSIKSMVTALTDIEHVGPKRYVRDQPRGERSTGREEEELVVEEEMDGSTEGV